MSYFKHIKQDVVADANNSSDTNLGTPSYAFTGTASSTLGVAGIQVSLFADKNCQVKIQQSPEGTNWDLIDTFYYIANGNFGVTVQAISSYVRVVVTTNMETTTKFRLQTALCPIAEPLPRSLDANGNLKVSMGIDEYGFGCENTPLGEQRVIKAVFANPMNVQTSAGASVLRTLDTGVTSIGAATTYLSVESDADTFWVGAGTGLAYGSFYGNELSAPYAVNNSYMRIADTGCATGEVNLVTYTDAGTTLTISKAGRYEITWDLSAESNTANKHVIGGIMIDSTTVLQAAGRNHFESTVANRQLSMGGNAIINCPNGNEVIGVGIGSDDASAQTITVDHVNLSIVQFGG